MRPTSFRRTANQSTTLLPDTLFRVEHAHERRCTARPLSKSSSTPRIPPASSVNAGKEWIIAKVENGTSTEDGLVTREAPVDSGVDGRRLERKKTRDEQHNMNKKKGENLHRGPKSTEAK